jgi:hypothetical protein
LKAFWCVIFPVPVILKRFFALEFVLTFGIGNKYLNETLEAFPQRGTLMEPLQAIPRFREGAQR